MNKPTVSIIIPTYNRAKLLERAIESVLNQTYDNIIEIIITDDGSTDNTKEVIEKYKKKDSRIIYVSNKKYIHGPTGNKNNGLDYASGEFIGLLDDDDILLENSISDLIEVYMKYGYKMIFGNCIRSDNNQFTGRHYNKSEEINYKDFFCGRFDGEYWGIFHINLIKDQRFFDKTWGAEHLFWWKLFKNNQVYYLHKAVRIYNVNQNENVSNKYFFNLDRTFLNYKLTLDIFGEDLLMFCPKRFVRWSLLAAYFSKLNGNYFLALKYWIYSFKTSKLFWLKVIAFFYLIFPLPKKLQIFVKKRLDKILKFLFNM